MSSASSAPNDRNSRPRKRKASSEKSASDHVADKKRTQNRISQQCLRGKQAAYLRQMESFIDVLKANTDTEDEDTRYSRLLKAHLDLLDEQKNCESALFRLRHKLLSLGTLANSAADDPIFTELASKPSTSSKIEQPATSSVETMGTEAHRDTPVQTNRVSPPLENHRLAHPQPNGPSDGEALLPNWGNCDMIGNEPQQPTDSTLPSQPDTIFDPSYQPEKPGEPSLWTVPQLRFPFGAFDVNARMSPDISHSPTRLSYLFPNQRTGDTHAVINNSTIFADQVKSAARHIMLMSIVEPQVPWNSLRGFNIDHDGANNKCMVERLASTAVEVIGALSGLEPYIYGVRFATYMEYVLRWRISAKPEDRLAIPKPFRPTPLQCATPEHPTVIDFINWHSIRDQMILYSAHLDLDTMSRDIVLNTVIELTQQRVAVNIYELLTTYILPRVRGCHVESHSSMLHNTEWVYLKIPSTANQSTSWEDSSLAQDVLATEMTSRMGLVEPNLLDSNLNKTGRPYSPRHAASFGPQTTLARFLTFFGIDQPANWKLSKDFARAYPFIDCSLDVSKYDMVGCKAVQFSDVDI
ncbi:hypothetical protein FDECE_9069 [Fusarium decemcellulare]|nr:hypothetical protein FDECE_9069 [Fusarium decemcellulare]